MGRAHDASWTASFPPPCDANLGTGCRSERSAAFHRPFGARTRSGARARCDAGHPARRPARGRASRAGLFFDRFFLPLPARDGTRHGRRGVSAGEWWRISVLRPPTLCRVRCRPRRWRPCARLSGWPMIAVPGDRTPASLRPDETQKPRASPRRAGGLERAVGMTRASGRRGTTRVRRTDRRGQVDGHRRDIDHGVGNRPSLEPDRHGTRALPAQVDRIGTHRYGVVTADRKTGSVPQPAVGWQWLLGKHIEPGTP